MVDELLSVLPSPKSSQAWGCLGLGGVGLPDSGFYFTDLALMPSQVLQHPPVSSISNKHDTPTSIVFILLRIKLT